MRGRIILVAVLVAALAAYAVYWQRTGVLRMPELLAPASPHEAYGEALEAHGLLETALGREWQASAARALSAPLAAETPHREILWFPADEPGAAGYSLRLRRGQQLSVVASVESVESTEPAQVFVDLFEVAEQGAERIASADRGSASLETEIGRDATYVLRVQPELLRPVRVTLELSTSAALGAPVPGIERRDIGSLFLAPRDGGRRDHHGVDIFAPHGTPVVAATDGIAFPGTNRLGGNVVWLWDPERRHRQYYAHLDEHRVASGTRVRRGDVLGTVGTTGNAQGTPPHLHFGIYTLTQGPIDPLPFVDPTLEPAPEIRAPLGRLGQHARVRTSRAMLQGSPGVEGNDPLPLARHTIVRVIGATDEQYRVRLPDGTEGFLTAAHTEPSRTPIRRARLPADTPLLASPSDRLVVGTLPAELVVPIHGRYREFLLVETRNKQRGWIPMELVASS